MASEKPFSPASERNRDPILEVLRVHFAGRRHVLEIGSGTGQHAVHFAAAMPWLVWQCSDRAEHLAGIRMWLDEARLANTPAPVELDVASPRWSQAGAGRAARTGKPAGPPLPAPHARHDGAQASASRFDAAFTANTLHIMGWGEVETCFAGLAAVLASNATVIAYGPFNNDGRFTSQSNRAFDAWLKARDGRSGIRDVEAVDALARSIGLQLIADVAMPANNRCLVWRMPSPSQPA
jgi:Protein of unknown function (DUF938)